MMPPPAPPLSRDQKIGIFGVLVAVVGIVIGVVVAVVPDQVRCWTHLGTCDRNGKPKSTADADKSTGPSQTKSPVGGTSSLIIVEAPADPNLPYGVKDPAPHSIDPGYSPVVSFTVPDIVNRGIGVADVLSGDHFDANSPVRIEWFEPGGSTFFASDTETDERGLFSTALIWRPLASPNGGLYGAWKLVASDLTSGQKAYAQVDVTSDGQTPPESTWNQSMNGGLQAIDDPALNIGTSGLLCKAPGAEVQASLQGFTPGAQVQFDVFRADGEREMSQGASADGQGRVTLRSWWMIGSCGSRTTFTYHATATQTGGKIRQSADLGLTTK